MRKKRFERILEENRYTVPTARPKMFYALVDVHGSDHEVKTIVISGNSRRDAENNALTEIEVNGWKARISGIYPVSA